MAKPTWYCPICQTEGTDPSVEFCPNEGARVKPRSERGAEWIGKTIAQKYRITRLGHAVEVDDIFAAEEIETGRKLSIKIVRPGIAESPELEAAVWEEASKVRAIEHHNLVELVDFGPLEGGGYFVVMEALFGLPLSDALEVGQISPRISLKIIAQACAGLAPVHAREFSHGDVRPEHLFLQDIGPESDPLLKILELGFGKLRGTGAARHISSDGVVSGAPTSMAPEQCLGEAGGAAADIYALGVLLYELLLGVLPFNDPSPITLLTQHLTEEPVWDRSLASDRGVPPEAELVVMRALAKNPLDRQASVLELKRDVEVVHDMMLRGSRHSRHVASPLLAAALPAETAKFDVVSLFEGNGVDGEIVQLAPGVFWVGRRHGVRLECNAYLRVFRGNDSELAMLISPGPQKDFEMVRTKIESVIGSLDRLDYILLCHQGPDQASIAAMIQQISSKAHVICSEDTWRVAQFYGLDPGRFTKTESFKNNRMNLVTGHHMIAVPVPFCPFAGSMMYFDPETKVLFSGDLFGGTSTGSEFVATSESAAGVELFHDIYMPSKEALLGAIERTSELVPQPELLAPGHGAIVDDSQLKYIVDKIGRLELGFGVSKTPKGDPRYLKAANEMVREFTRIVGDDKTEQLLHTFVDGGSFGDLFYFEEVTNITAFRVAPHVALEILFRDALKAAPVGQKSDVSTALGVALNRVLSG